MESFSWLHLRGFIKTNQVILNHLPHNFINIWKWGFLFTAWVVEIDVETTMVHIFSHLLTSLMPILGIDSFTHRNIFLLGFRSLFVTEDMLRLSPWLAQKSNKKLSYWITTTTHQQIVSIFFIVEWSSQRKINIVESWLEPDQQQ